ncbi:hypothetical protein MNEG_13676 [Monoraphidium neglectum]|uniref:Cyanobacterial aminoacyl-tRNA synthetase CAAD domain-containing protein n=1 Tax=Monoraphidium neglectum TaxID=145388 RepID=A0A0D2MGW7_9CHLO|nr:hypothetical protein MNEG_13676 [Monoraphidium neglectum]KIY94285.1 hypothetical protein MNEG_13676 [Monoraphidium neglectum]|eukprot:XP_013893305.1 hypothetical protein MNEG_13676 [Monoraphidium neglectum]
MLLSAQSRAAMRPAGPQARLMSVRPTVARNIRARASEPSGVDAEELQRKLERVSSDIKEKWEKTDDKPGAVLVIGGTVVAVALAFNLVNAIDKIPVVSDLIELVGIGVTGWYLTVGPDRDELFISIKEFFGKVYKF